MSHSGCERSISKHIPHRFDHPSRTLVSPVRSAMTEASAKQKAGADAAFPGSHCSSFLKGFSGRCWSTCWSGIISPFICLDQIVVRPLLRCAQAVTVPDPQTSLVVRLHGVTRLSSARLPISHIMTLISRCSCGPLLINVRGKYGN